MKNKCSHGKDCVKKKLSSVLNNQENKVIMKKNIHKLLALNLKNYYLVLNSNYYTNNHELTGRINRCQNLNDNNLFSKIIKIII